MKLKRLGVTRMAGAAVFGLVLRPEDRHTHVDLGQGFPVTGSDQYTVAGTAVYRMVWAVLMNDEGRQ
jgi:hypothetical protein